MENQKANYHPPGHQLYVTRLSTLFKIFTQNKIAKSKRGMVLKVLFFSMLSWPLQVIQRVIFWFKLRKVNLGEKPPIFILGHWRSGTTHVHYLMAKDPSLGFLSNFQSFFFNISTIGLGWFDRMVSPHTPTKRPQDNMQFNVLAPQEEEQVLANMSNTSCALGFFFPKSKAYFDKYLTFDTTTKSEKAKWQQDYLYVLKSISHMAGGKRLVIKNPSNTARVKQLLELFPDAKFIYIHRNPYSVYLSTLHLARVVWTTQCFQDMTEEDFKGFILDNYTRVQGAYLKQRSLIPKENLIEVAYDEIGAGSEAMFTRIYKELGLDNYEETLPYVQEYLKTIKNYKKNKFIPIEDEIVKRIQTDWKFAFDEFGYDLEYKDESKAV